MLKTPAFSLDAMRNDHMPAFVAGGLSATAMILAYNLLSSPPPMIIKAPPREHKQGSSYPSDFYPGAKDIPTPYGSVRLYEFGPEKGERVLFVHGITTPSAVFAGILPELVDAGYRVCTFDLFGRGYSDSPDLKHDDRLYTTQILCVLQSIGWTKCSVVGYSLGGGITASFASYFPSTVSKLILIAPAGLLARKNIPLSQKIAMNEKMPFSVVEFLRSFIVPKGKEIVKKTSGGRADVAQVSEWQTQNHRGFARSYLSSFRHALIFDEWETFERLRSTNTNVQAIWGVHDDIVDTRLVSENLKRALPEVNIAFIDDVGHDVCTGKPGEVAKQLLSMLK